MEKKINLNVENFGINFWNLEDFKLHSHFFKKYPGAVTLSLFIKSTFVLCLQGKKKEMPKHLFSYMV